MGNYILTVTTAALSELSDQSKTSLNSTNV